MSTPRLQWLPLIQNSLLSPKVANTELPAGKQLFSPQDWAMPGPGAALGAEESGEEKESISCWDGCQPTLPKA